MKKARAHVLIKGRVQGVFFRGEASEEAQRLGLSGWVRNKWDGSVEAVFEGKKVAIEEMIGWCHKGPPSAIVREVEVKWEEYKGEFTSFSIRY